MAYNSYPISGVVNAAAKTDINNALDTLNRLIGGSASAWAGPHNPATGSVNPDGGSASRGGATDGDPIPQQLNKQMEDEIAAIKAGVSAAAEA